MWILLAVFLKTVSSDITVPILDQPITHNTLEECQTNMNLIYSEYKVLQANYPVEIEFKINDNNQKYMRYSYKPDYTKPKITIYYYCLRTYKK